MSKIGYRTDLGELFDKPNAIKAIIIAIDNNKQTCHDPVWEVLIMYKILACVILLCVLGGWGLGCASFGPRSLPQTLDGVKCNKCPPQEVTDLMRAAACVRYPTYPTKVENYFRTYIFEIGGHLECDYSDKEDVPLVFDLRYDHVEGFISTNDGIMATLELSWENTGPIMRGQSTAWYTPGLGRDIEGARVDSFFDALSRLHRPTSRAPRR